MFRFSCALLGLLTLGLVLGGSPDGDAASNAPTRNPFRPLVGAPTPRPSTAVPPDPSLAPLPPPPPLPPLPPRQQGASPPSIPLLTPDVPGLPFARPTGVPSSSPAKRPAPRFAYVGFVYDAAPPGGLPAGLLAALRVDGRVRLVRRGDRVGDALVGTLTVDRLVLVSPRGVTVLYRTKP